MKNLLFLIFLGFSGTIFAVDINIASAKELAYELSGIGLVKAQRIIEYREQIGSFVSPEQLIEVKGIGPKILARNRDKIYLSPRPYTQPSKNIITNKNLVSLDLSPNIEKPFHPIHKQFWDALIIMPLFIACLFIFIVAWFKGAKKDTSMPRKHLVSTTFVCCKCGKVTSFQNIHYDGHFSTQYVDGDLPPGWSCIPNWQGKPCDYCDDCSK